MWRLYGEKSPRFCLRQKTPDMLRVPLIIPDQVASVSYPGGVFRPTRHRTTTARHAHPTVAPVPLASLATARRKAC
jgi:hypothetical protein